MDAHHYFALMAMALVVLLDFIIREVPVIVFDIFYSSFSHYVFILIFDSNNNRENYPKNKWALGNDGYNFKSNFQFGLVYSSN